MIILGYIFLFILGIIIVSAIIEGQFIELFLFIIFAPIAIFFVTGFLILFSTFAYLTYIAFFNYDKFERIVYLIWNM